MTNAVFDLIEPQQILSAVVFASPHSGAVYPEALKNKTVLTRQALRSSEDAFVDQLFAAAPGFGAPLICAQVPRAFVDLNRSPDELDPALIAGIRKQGHNPRVASGLGVIPRVVSNGRSIYRGKIPLAEAESRLRDCWHPYHQALQFLLARAHDQFGQAILVDCHSMPHEAIENLSVKGRRPEIVLGDRFGASASSEVVDKIEAAFVATGLNVVRNSPFAGAYITQAYGRPSREQHAIQIEIDRSIYMDERQIRPNANFDMLRGVLNDVIRDIAAIGQSQLPCAAE
ncbi:N-formylglutamate amidohydrolase [Rhodobacteraceae bacterium M382]|nr:N-formylglutamate amidohydrolase [Rhodobacteraceae bacterium M382]